MKLSLKDVLYINDDGHIIDNIDVDSQNIYIHFLFVSC